jgi:hypothetical protein
MGWTFSDSWKTKDDVITDILRDGNFIDKTLKGTELWTIMQDAAGARFIVLFLLAKERGSYGYKVMDESMGPYYYKCPVSFLDRVPATNHEWRAKVYAYADLQKAKRLARKQRDAVIDQRPCW